MRSYKYKVMKELRYIRNKMQREYPQLLEKYKKVSREWEEFHEKTGKMDGHSKVTQAKDDLKWNRIRYNESVADLEKIRRIDEADFNLAYQYGLGEKAYRIDKRYYR